MKEIWKDIEGYEGLYQVSNLGRVKSLGNDKSRKEKILKPGLMGRGKSRYYGVILSKNRSRKTVKVHRLVANAFIENPENLPVINHIDENKLNNCVSNLEWCTVEYNTRYSQAKKVGCYKNGQLIKIYPSIKSTIKDGFNQGNIIRCCNKKYGYRSHHGFQWRYI